jgi:hypothetical protein
MVKIDICRYNDILNGAYTFISFRRVMGAFFKEVEKPYIVRAEPNRYSIYK